MGQVGFRCVSTCTPSWRSRQPFLPVGDRLARKALETHEHRLEPIEVLDQFIGSPDNACRRRISSVACENGAPPAGLST